MKITTILVLLLGVFLLLLLGGAFFTVRETDTVILTQFGAPVGDPITAPGLHWKAPFVQEVNRLEKRVLEFDGQAIEMPTKDKTFLALSNERRAQSRLEDIIGSEVRAAVASHELIEVIRSDKSRVMPLDVQNQRSAASALPAAKRGRLELEKDILAAAAPKLLANGIELLDVRIKRVNYNAGVLPGIYRRMISERQQIAQRFRSEGEGEAARILGRKERDLREVESIAYKQVQQARGEADAEATRIYAEAYNKTAEAREFYTFVKTLETWRTTLGASTNLVLSTDSDLFGLLKRSGR